MLKINLSSSMRPTIALPSIVILLVLCIALYTQKERERSLRLVKEVELLRTIEAKSIVETNLKEAQNQIQDRDEEVKLALDKLEKETVRRQELEVKVEELVACLPVKLEKIVIKNFNVLTGKVLSFNPEHSFVVVNLGNKDNLKMGDILSVYRDDKFIGRVEVEKVDEATSAAVVLASWKNTEYKENDVVKKL